VDEPKPPKRRSSKSFILILTIPLNFLSLGKTTQKPTDEETAQSQAKLKVPKEDPKSHLIFISPSKIPPLGKKQKESLWH